MSDKKNIDRVFQEKFKDYEVFPEANVWKGIEKELTKKKKKRRIIPLWLRLAGAAAILLMLIPVGNWIYNNNNAKPAIPDTNIITDTDKNDVMIKDNASSENEKINTVLDNENDTVNSNTNSGQGEEQLITTVQQTNSKNTYNNKVNTNKENKKSTNLERNIEIATTKQNTLEQYKNNAINQINASENQLEYEETKVAVLETNAKEEENAEKSDLLVALEKQKTDEKIADVNRKKWSIGSAIGPVYFNTSSQGSPIDPSLANNVKSSSNSISYGLKVNYKITDRFSLQSGIQNVDLGYATENVSVIASSALLDKSKTNINSDLGATLQVSSTASQNSETFSNRSPFDTNGSLDQSFSYVEVPLEAKYAIVQKKLGINLVGGLSTYFLYDNDVSITSFGKKTSLGEASNLNDINFSGNVGLDVNYNLSPNLFLNASPMLKYQLNTFSENSGGFKPYFFGVYAGLNFRF